MGAGPGDPTLITVRGAQCLAQADLVLYDYLINPELLRYAPESSEQSCVGHPHSGYAKLQEDVNQQMVTAARAGRFVVRLKSCDPHIFGRGAEEVAALAAAEVPFEVVPGVTAASAFRSKVAEFARIRVPMAGMRPAPTPRILASSATRNFKAAD